MTDATGLYRVPQLPPGTYTLRFEKETYRPYSRTGIDVAADRTLRLNVELLPETRESEPRSRWSALRRSSTWARAPSARTINQDFVRNLAVSRPDGIGGANRSFDSLAATAPQAGDDLYGVSHQRRAHRPRTSYLIDGLVGEQPRLRRATAARSPSSSSTR